MALQGEILPLYSKPKTEDAALNGWQWRHWEGLPYLTCSLLESWNHGFFTQLFSPRFPAELVSVLQPEAKVYRVKQVHGNTVLTPSEINASTTLNQGCELGEEGKLPPADGIVTDRPQQAVWVCSADCTPLLIADAKRGTVAAIHAGWRGTAQRIVPEAIARFISAGSQLQDLRIAMGPAIAGEVYQVSVNVAAEVGASIIADKNPNNDLESILDSLQQIPNSPLFPDEHPGRVRLDVRRVNEIQLHQLGIASEQIAIAPHCTYQEPERFFSYRREKLKKVQWSGIVSRDNPM